MANEFSTAGVTVKYAIEQTSGTRPVSGYTVIPGIKSIPDIGNSEPSLLEVTDLSDKTRKRYIPGLQDNNGSVSFGANLTADFKTKWAALCAAATEGQAASKSAWFEIAIPQFDSFYFSGMPTELGFSAMEVDAVAEATVYITPNTIEGWGTAST